MNKNLRLIINNPYSKIEQKQFFEEGVIDQVKPEDNVIIYITIKKAYLGLRRQF